MSDFTKTEFRTKTCPFDRQGCSESCMSFVPDPLEIGDGKTELTSANCAVLAGLSAIAKVGDLFDPELAKSLTGVGKILAPAAITRKIGLFRGKSKDGGKS